MNRKFISVVLMAALAALAVACASKGGAGKAPKTASGEGTAVYVLINRGIEKSFTDIQVTSRNQVGEWMEQDLPAVLGKAGYKARLIKRRSEFRPAEGAYLLTVKITKYNPGSKAARMFVGYGAGAASMDTHFELYGRGSRPMLTGDPSVGSGRDWRNVIRKVNEITVKAMSDKLSE